MFPCFGAKETLQSIKYISIFIFGDLLWKTKQNFSENQSKLISNQFCKNQRLLKAMIYDVEINKKFELEIVLCFNWELWAPIQ